MVTATQAKRKARRAERSDPVEALARFGLVCRGVVWFVIGLLAVDIALGGRAEADKQGALGAIKDQPLGEVLLAVLGVGFLGYAAWRALEGVVGHRDADEGLKRWSKRLASLFRAAVYGSLAWSTAHFVLGNGGEDNTRPLTQRTMAHTGGTLLVGLVGAGVIVGGLVMAVRGLRQEFDDKLKPVPKSWRPPVHVVATTGLVVRGLAIALIGGFVLQAALTYDPGKAKGLDAALKTFAGHLYGRGVVGLVGIGLLCFGLWSFAEARWRRI
ncbi:MAG: putative integral rane protein [Frankiales bacterium]|nr:putative integral rane protein [Frankiales bacterium]